MNNLIETRKKVYKNFPKKNLSKNLSDIVLLYDISDKDYKYLIETTQNFLFKSLSLIHKKEFIWSDTFLQDNDDLIQSLPNKTPNGTLFPKKETILEFIEIQKAINNVLNNLDIYPHIKKMVIPNIRYKSANEIEDIKTRPYYTGKLHSDAWVGHKGDSVFLIGVLGDLDNNTVEFYEPLEVSDNYLYKADSFDEGNTRYKSLNYLGKLNKQTLGIMDHACIHRTLMNKNSGPRISIDIAVLIDSEYSHSNDKGFDEYIYSYHNSDAIKSIGVDKTYESETSIFDTKYSNIKII